HAGPPVWSLDVPRGPARALALEGSTGQLAVLDSENELIVYSLPDLYRSLRERGLGLAFPPARWKGPAPDGKSAAPTHADWRRRAEELHRRREWACLLWACCVALEQEPRDARLWFLRGQAEAQIQGRAAPAREAYTRALALDDKDWRVWQARGNAHA